MADIETAMVTYKGIIVPKAEEASDNNTAKNSTTPGIDSIPESYSMNDSEPVLETNQDTTYEPDLQDQSTIPSEP